MLAFNAVVLTIGPSWSQPWLGSKRLAGPEHHAFHQEEEERLKGCPLPPSRMNATLPIFSVVPPEAVGYCKMEVDVCPSIFLSLKRIYEELAKDYPTQMSRFVINIGGKDGKSADPLYPLLEGMPTLAGIVLEPSPRSYTLLRANMAPFRNMVAAQAGVSPSTAASILQHLETATPTRLAGSGLGKAAARLTARMPELGRSVGTPRQSIDILKIDIDGCDCHILEQLLAKGTYFHAKVIQVELNHFIPPPIVYKDMCAEDRPGRNRM